MTAEFHDLEESLKAFLNDANSDSYNSKSSNNHKYNNLKILIDLKKTKTPHFIVRLGISESVHRLGNCEKILGGLGSEERYIKRWYEKPQVASALGEAWKLAQKAETVQMVNEPD